jgi:sulfide:quinone oxidoreductase
VELDPIKQTARTAGGQIVEYDFLVLTPGLQINWNKVEGISRETLGQGNAHCIYDFEGAQRIWPAIQELVAKGGRGVFTDTYTKLKCGGAPKKICMLTEHLARKEGKRDGVQIDYFCCSDALYNVPLYTPRLLQIYEERNIGLEVNHRVKGIDTQAKKVYLEHHEKKKVKEINELGKEVEVERTIITPRVEDYDLLSFVPPQSAPDFVREAGLSWTEGKLAKDGWAMVDKKTLTHIRYSNIVCLGDVAGIPTSKTSSAIRIQLPIAVDNLISIMQGKDPEKIYNGYACCPIVTDYGHVLLCEFDYNKDPDPSFPFTLQDMSKEQASAWMLKRHFLKPMFFHGMLTGLM